MDLHQLHTAAQALVLTDAEKAAIIARCKQTKRRPPVRKALVAVAAALVLTLAAFSPGFLFRAGSAAKDAAVEDEYALQLPNAADRANGEQSAVTAASLALPTTLGDYLAAVPDGTLHDGVAQYVHTELCTLVPDTALQALLSNESAPLTETPDAAPLLHVQAVTVDGVDAALALYEDGTVQIWLPAQPQAAYHVGAEAVEAFLATLTEDDTAKGGF